MVNHKVSQYEEVLNTGETLVLELVSPLQSEGARTGSLVLNYQVLTAFLQYKQTHTTEEQRAQLIRDKEDNLKILHQQELYLLLKTDDKGIARFCGVSDSSPNTSSCDRWVRVVQNMQGWQLSGPHHYFIPNGVEMPLSTWVRFLGARYAQFRQGKDGELLLVQLLDGGLQPIVVENSTFTDLATE
nr:GDYXXLXY domain-containing protein [Pelistega europaea]